MHSEDQRARQAARAFRSRLNVQPLADADTLLKAADNYCGFNRVVLPPDDPLLAGADAILDRDFQTIWLNRGRPMQLQAVDSAHEYGHLVLHPDPAYAHINDIDFATGYSKNQRDEVDAHIFAAEFLLPLFVATREFNELGCSATEIAAKFGIPRRLVVRQLSQVVDVNSEFNDIRESDNIVPDNWQLASADANSSTMVIGAPGTGKTTSLLVRCANLLRSGDISASQILIVVENSHFAAAMRERLSATCGGDGALCSVTTSYRLAYDLLVRFPEYAGLTERWEEDDDLTVAGVRPIVQGFPATAHDLLIRQKEVRDVLALRYQQVLVDDIDLLNSDCMALVLAAIGAVGSPLWATCRKAPTSISVNRRHMLAFEYRSSPAIHAFMGQVSPAAERHTIRRRPADKRCGQGSVTVFVASNKVEMLTGLTQTVGQRLNESYSSEDVLLINKSAKVSSATLSIALQKELPASARELTATVGAIGLLAVLDLCLGKFSCAALLRAASLPNYSVPLRELSAIQNMAALAKCASDPGVDESLRRLALNIDRSSRARNVREMLEIYLFDASSYVRVGPSAAKDAQTLLSLFAELSPKDVQEGSLLRNGTVQTALKKRFGGRGYDFSIVSSGVQWSRRESPIVIVVDADINLLISKKDGEEQMAAMIAKDHVAYWVLRDASGRTLRLCDKLKSLCPGIGIVEWREREKHPQTDRGLSEYELARLSESQRKDYERCPRRVYYRHFVEGQNVSDRLKSPLQMVVSRDFPAEPADTAFCLNCTYSDICPIELR